MSFLRQLSGYGDNLRQLSFFIFKSMVQQVTKNGKDKKLSYTYRIS